MTAEVIILNKSAVALAADSAVTVGEGDSGKIYNTVNKVFTLSKYHAVGVMIYANADYMGVPVETIVKMYRQSLAQKQEETVSRYASEFIKYLGSAQFCSNEQQIQNVRRTWQVVFDDISDDIRRAIRTEIISNGECSTRRQKQIISEVNDFHLTRLEGCEAAVGFEKRKPLAIVQEYEKQYDLAQRASLLPHNPNKAAILAWKKIAGLSVTKAHRYPTYTGIVVAGFGASEVFPQYVATRLDGIISGVQKFEVSDTDGITHEGNRSMIVPFAQSEMVGRFVEGVDSEYHSFISGATSRALSELADAIIDVHVSGTDAEKDKIRQDVRKSIGSQTKEFIKAARDWRREKFANPVLDALVNLPKEELANLAEALVNLTSIKRRVSIERETVGGPIDVAVISKGDGFIWIKRKHYFKPELNPNFLANYRSVAPEESDNGSS